MLAAVALLALSFVAAGQESGKSYSLPPGSFDVENFAVSPGGNAIVFTTKSDDDGKQNVFVFNLKTAAVKKVATAASAHVFAVPGAHPFAVLAGTNLYFLQDDGSSDGPMEIPNTGDTLGWGHDGSDFVFTMDKPKINKDSEDYNESGFTALGILDVATQKVHPVAVKLPAYHFDVLQTNGQIFVTDNSMDNDKPLIVNVYDMKGKHIETRNDLYGIVFSPTGRYYLPYVFEAGLSFRVRDAETNRPVLSFENNGNEEVAEPRWNPRIDTLLLVEHLDTDEKGNTTGQRLDVLGIPSGKIMKSMPYGIAQWAQDGKSVVIFRGGKFIFEDLNP